MLMTLLNVSNSVLMALTACDSVLFSSRFTIWENDLYLDDPVQPRSGFHLAFFPLSNENPSATFGVCPTAYHYLLPRLKCAELYFHSAQGIRTLCLVMDEYIIYV